MLMTGVPDARHQPPNKLDEEERESILEVANSPEYSGSSSL